MDRVRFRHAVGVVALASIAMGSTGCIAVSRSSRTGPPAAAVVHQVEQEWSCDSDESFDLAAARADLSSRIAARAERGWQVVDFEIGRIRQDTCLVATFRRVAAP